VQKSEEQKSERVQGFEDSGVRVQCSRYRGFSRGRGRGVEREGFKDSRVQGVECRSQKSEVQKGFKDSRIPRPGPQQCGPVAGGFQEWIDVAGVLHLHSDYFANFSISLQISATFFPLKRSFLICV